MGDDDRPGSFDEDPIGSGNARPRIHNSTSDLREFRMRLESVFILLYNKK